jgi:stress-induced morphogen
LQTEKVEEMLKEVFPEAKVRVRDMTGTGDHFEIWVASKNFAGKTLIQQHQMVHRALEKEMDRAIHAVQIKTQEE